MDQEDSVRTLTLAVSSVPFGALTFIALVSAVIFNVGYFVVVGLPFISLFSVQESALFSLSAVTPVWAIILVIQNIESLSTIRTQFKDDDALKRASNQVIVTISVISFIVVVGSRTYLYYIDSGFYVSISFFGAALAASALALAMVYKDMIQEGLYYPFLFYLLAILFFMIGVFFGVYSIYEKHRRSDYVAIMDGGLRVSVVRLGQEYTLVSFDDYTIHVIRTESLRDISATPPIPN